ncbi:hypothetical protein [Holdemanella porci]|uniref:hypothetical protein n=1 Tax=Holdemanella porci TaxID=2652276 RepID=UPI003AF10BDC
MKKKSKYRVRMDELKRFKKKHKLTKKEKERVEMWVESGHSAYDTRWWDELEQEEELDELLCGLTDKQKEYVYSYCMNWNPFIDEPYFDYERFEELDLKNLPTFESEEEPEIDLPF